MLLFAHARGSFVESDSSQLIQTALHDRVEGALHRRHVRFISVVVGLITMVIHNRIKQSQTLTILVSISRHNHSLLASIVDLEQTLQSLNAFVSSQSSQWCRTRVVSRLDSIYIHHTNIILSIQTNTYKNKHTNLTFATIS